MSHQQIENKDIKTEIDKKAIEEKLYRTKLYQEDKKLYKKIKADFVYGVSQNFRQKRNNRKQEMKQLDEETLQVYQEGEKNEY
ncbi:hypothetical protein [Anaerosporobacter sp.]